MRASMVFGLICVAVQSGACVSHLVPANREWYRPAAQSLFAGASEIDAADIHVVAKESRAESVERLQSVSVVSLSQSDAVRLVGSTLDVAGPYFLIRGLRVGCRNGTFSVYSNRDIVIIDHASLAPRGKSPTMWPIIVKLPKAPTEIYVQYSAAR